jgi:uncharacterized protein
LYNKLKILYQLQLIDDQLDILEELRGDLPNAVNELQNKIKELKEQMVTKEGERKASNEKRIDNEDEIERLKANQKKFKSQLYQVRNNKEYDALTKEIDHSEDQIKKFETENIALEDTVQKLKSEILDVAPQLETLKVELKAKEAELKEIVKSNEKEEAKLKQKRNEVETQIKKPDLSIYMRIRKAKGGIAVATIKRTACSGCHNVVPPQRQLEIRQNRRLFNCEYCGRILVSAEIAEEVEKDS